MNSPMKFPNDNNKRRIQNTQKCHKEILEISSPMVIIYKLKYINLFR